MSQHRLTTLFVACLFMFVAGVSMLAMKAFATDRYAGVSIEGTVQGLTTPSSYWAAITPSNSVAIAGGVPRAIYSHDGGNVSCVGKDTVAATFLFTAGEIKPLRCVRVNATGTTSATLTAMY